MSNITNIAEKNRKSLQHGLTLSQKTPEINLLPNSIAEVLSHENVFTPEECAKILALPGEFEQAEVAMKLSQGDEHEVRPAIRNNTNFLIKPGEDNYWVLEKLLEIVTAVNNKFYKFEINQFQGVQISKYEVGEFYKDHMDIGSGVLGNRKISLTLQLSDPDSYEGGDLVLDFAGFTAPRGLGSVTLFPSFIKHGVRPVTKGTRYSLVAWVSGKNRFR